MGFVVKQQSSKTEVIIEDSRTQCLATREKRKLDAEVEECSEQSNNKKPRKGNKVHKEIKIKTILMRKQEREIWIKIHNRPGVAGAVL